MYYYQRRMPGLHLRRTFNVPFVYKGRTILPFHIINVDRRNIIGTFIDSSINVPLSIITPFMMDDAYQPRDIDLKDLDLFDIQTHTSIEESAFLPWYIRPGDVILYLQ